MSGHGKRTRRGKKALTGGWTVVPSKTYPNRVYFFNTITGCSTWENPCQDTNDVEVHNSSSKTLSSERSHLLKAEPKYTSKSQTKKQKGRTVLNSPNRNSNNRINSEIEDYDDNDQYFSEVPINAFNSSHKHLITPSSSPDLVSFSQTNISDTDNVLLKNNEKQLWVHLISTPDKHSMRKSVTVSDFQKPTTSHTSRMDDGNENSSFGGNKTKKKKKKKKELISEGKGTVEKINKNVWFKNSDKTPAQTRLLKLRKENAEKLKQLAAKCPQVHGVGGDSKIKKGLQICDLEQKTPKFSEEILKKVDIQNSYGWDENNQSSADFVEEMDWEPSNEESDVRNINVFRQQLDKPNEGSSDIFFGLNSQQSCALPSKTHSWLVVLDTNIFVSCLSFVKELRDTKVPDLGFPFIYVPWRVLQELDRLKDTKIYAVDKNLHVNVRKAISYLNDNFKSSHPRVFGQSLEDFARMIDMDVFAPDDEILHTCIQLQKQHADKKLVLLTNDKNLESKAIVSGVEVYSKDRFQKKYMKPSSNSSTASVSALNKSSSGGLDNCLCEVKAILKDFLTMVVETEMRIAFEEDWIKMVVRKPPWSLEDVLKCLLKHWIAVFFLVFSNDARSEAELLHEGLFRRETVNAEQVSDVIKTAQRLLVSIRKSQKKKRPYLDLIPVAIAKLSDMLKMSSPCQAEVSFAPLPTSSKPYLNSEQQVCQNDAALNDISKVKNLFKDIWDCLRSFCCSLSVVIHSPGTNADTIVQEIRPKLTQISNEAREIVATVEKILEVNAVDVDERHPAIVHLSNFLMHVYPNMVPDLKNDLTRCLAAFFRDFEGRSLINISLKDFKEFIQDLSKAAEYFNVQYTC